MHLQVGLNLEVSRPCVQVCREGLLLDLRFRFVAKTMSNPVYLFQVELPWVPANHLQNVQIPLELGSFFVLQVLLDGRSKFLNAYLRIRLGDKLFQVDDRVQLELTVKVDDGED